MSSKRAVTHGNGAHVEAVPCNGTGTLKHHCRLAVSVPEAAEMLGISRSLAYELVHRRELRAVRLGRRLVVPLTALEAVISLEGGTHPSFAANVAVDGGASWS